LGFADVPARRSRSSSGHPAFQHAVGIPSAAWLDDLRDGPVERLWSIYAYLEQGRPRRAVPLRRLGLPLQGHAQFLSCEQALLDQVFTDPGDDGRWGGRDGRGCGQALQIGPLGE
jgi:hypothetical protein